MSGFKWVLVVLWIHLFWSLVPSWRDGQYYEFGWLMPLLAGALAWRRWDVAREKNWLEASPDFAKVSMWLTVIGMAAYLLGMLPLRMVGISDTGWRIPIWVHVVSLVGLTHLWLWSLGGRRLTMWMIPVTILALTAVPYPWQIEQAMVRGLTGAVTGVTHEILLLEGVPAERLGETIRVGKDVVEIGDACSGIKSFQGLLMAAVFFGELLWLGVGRRIGLVLVAGGVSLVTNTLRAWWLAELQFAQGKAAVDAAHDSAGHLAFAVGCVILYLAAAGMVRAGGRRRKVVRRKL